jgi:hypothetical protein
MPNEFVIKNGYFSQGNSNVTGSLNVSTSVTASNIRATLQGTASWASNAVSYAHVSGASSGRLLLSDGTTGFHTASANLIYIGTTFSVTGSTIMSASVGLTPLTVQGSGSTPIFRVQGSTGTLFSVTDIVGGSLFSVTNASAVPIFDVQSTMTSSFSGSVIVHTTGSSITSASARPLSLIHNTTATPTQSLGVGIEFESETTTTEGTTIGFLDYVWTTNTNGSEWGQTEIVLKDSGTSVRSHMLAPGVIGSFNGGLTAATPQLGDFTGAYPEYRVYGSGSTTDGTQTTLTYNVWTTPTGLAIPNDTTWMFTTYIVARRTDADNESAAYWLQGAIDNNAGTVALVGAVQVTAIEDTVAWDATAVAFGGRLVHRVTGEAGKTIRWNLVTHIVQVSG